MFLLRKKVAIAVNELTEHKSQIATFPSKDMTVHGKDNKTPFNDKERIINNSTRELLLIFKNFKLQILQLR